MTIIITISGLNVSVVISRQVLGIQCHYTELRHMGGGRTSSFTNFSSKVSRKRFQRSKSLALYNCICAHLFVKENLKPCWFSQLVFLHSDGRKKDDILLYHFHQNTFGQAPPRCLCWLARRYFHLSFNLVLLYLNLVEVCVERIPLGHVYRTHGQ